MIDSLKYSSNWGGIKGFSLERISFTNESSDSSNWGISLNINGATPGLINSLIDIPRLSEKDIVINEIMYEPASGNSEFLELYNTSNDSIQLGGMSLKIGDSKKFELSKTYFLLPPLKYIVLASDSSVLFNYDYLYKNENIVLINNALGLPNDGTPLVIKDMYGTIIDSLNYLSEWHNKNIIDTRNISLERLNTDVGSNDPSNWSSCVDPAGATPGIRNSIFVESVSSTSKVFVSPNPFSPDDDGFEDFTTINFNLPFKLAQVRIKVFDSVGRLVRVLENNTPSSSSNTVIFDGLDGNGRALRIGIYILLIEAVGDNGSTEELKTPVVIARKL